MNFQDQIRENGNRPSVQSQIIKAAEAGAKYEGFDLTVSLDGSIKAGDRHTADSIDDALAAAQTRVNETEIEE